MPPPPPYVGEDFSFGSRAKLPNNESASCGGEKQRLSVSKSSSSPSKMTMMPEQGKPKEMPPAPVLAKLILRMVGRKLLQNPNTYSSLLGLVWSLISFK
jgi:auxin efflux carrier family